MLAAHRDQENLAHSHPAASRQQPKTPGARYPKTPLKVPRNDENAPTAFAAKSGAGATARLGGNDKMMAKGNGTRQALVTPTETRARAPLGNKTTNAKARTGQTGGVKNMVREIEQSQVKPTTIQRQKQKQKPAGQAPVKSAASLQDPLDEDEPEYAPPKAEPLPYESDVLPKGGITFEGLKKENLLRGYYQHYFNLVDENGVSRKEKEFEKEMEAVMDKAVAQNDREVDALNWGASDIGEMPKTRRAAAPGRTLPANASRKDGTSSQTRVSTITSRRAASALAIPSDRQKAVQTKATASAGPARRPLSSLIQGCKPARPAQSGKASPAESVAGEVASRTTLGYNKGRSASSMVHPGGQSNSTRSSRPTQAPALLRQESDATITPARARQAAKGGEPGLGSKSRPQFLSIFDDGGDDEDLPSFSGPEQPQGDEEEFELKLDV